jgi:hypothetical protein
VLIPKRDARPSGFFLHHDDASVEMGHHAALRTNWTGPRRDGAREVGLAAVRGPSARAVGLSKPELGPRDTGHIFVAADAPKCGDRISDLWKNRRLRPRAPWESASVF